MIVAECTKVSICLHFVDSHVVHQVGHRVFLHVGHIVDHHVGNLVHLHVGQLSHQIRAFRVSLVYSVWRKLDCCKTLI